MKLTVNKNLNIRTGAPSTSAPNPGYHPPGTVLDIDKIFVGDNINGNSIWYQCADDGHYYWSGGFAEEEFVLGNAHLHHFKDNEQVEILLSVQNDKGYVLSKKVELFTGTGIGYKNYDADKKLALIVNVEKRLDGKDNVKNPIKYRGVAIPVDVMEVGKLVLQAKYWDIGPRLPMGGSICRLDGELLTQELLGLGSRTAILKSGTKRFLLTCGHVLLKGLFQNGRYDREIHGGEYYGGFAFKNWGGKTQRNLLIVEGCYNSYHDYAIAELTQNDEYILRNSVDDEDFMTKIKSAYTEPEIIVGQSVTMFGTISRKRHSKIRQKGCPIPVLNEDLIINDLIFIDMVSQKGDSGAPVIGEDGRILGYILGEDFSKNVSVVMPFYKIINNTKYSIDA